ncbi:MAG: hypothetical protein WDW38_002431 [Sanguina aurantia]
MVGSKRPKTGTTSAITSRSTKKPRRVGSGTASQTWSPSHNNQVSAQVPAAAALRPDLQRKTPAIKSLPELDPAEEYLLCNDGDLLSSVVASYPERHRCRCLQFYTVCTCVAQSGPVNPTAASSFKPAAFPAVTPLPCLATAPASNTTNLLSNNAPQHGHSNRHTHTTAAFTPLPCAASLASEAATALSLGTMAAPSSGYGGTDASQVGGGIATLGTVYLFPDTSTHQDPRPISSNTCADQTPHCSLQTAPAAGRLPRNATPGLFLTSKPAAPFQRNNALMRKRSSNADVNPPPNVTSNATAHHPSIPSTTFNLNHPNPHIAPYVTHNFCCDARGNELDNTSTAAAIRPSPHNSTVNNPSNTPPYRLSCTGISAAAAAAAAAIFDPPPNTSTAAGSTPAIIAGSFNLISGPTAAAPNTRIQIPDKEAAYGTNDESYPDVGDVNADQEEDADDQEMTSEDGPTGAAEGADCITNSDGDFEHSDSAENHTIMWEDNAVPRSPRRSLGYAPMPTCPASTQPVLKFQSSGPQQATLAVQITRMPSRSHTLTTSAPSLRNTNTIPDNSIAPICNNRPRVQAQRLIPLAPVYQNVSYVGPNQAEYAHNSSLKRTFSTPLGGTGQQSAAIPIILAPSGVHPSATAPGLGPFFSSGIIPISGLLEWSLPAGD